MKFTAIFALVTGARIAASKAVGSWQPPQETGAAVAAGELPDLAPKPTPLAALELPELFRRDDTEHTCGYLNGSTAYPLTCGGSNVCSTSIDHGVWHCCSSGASSCSMPTACLDYTAFSNGLCANIGVSTTCCSQSGTPLCTTIPFADKPSISLVGCLASSFIVPVYASPQLTTTSAPTTTSSTSSTSSSSSSSSTSSTATSSSDTSGGNNNIGAIVGGVVGGVAVIGIIAAAVAWIIVRNKRQPPAAPAAAAAAAAAAPPPPPNSYPTSGHSQPPMAQHGYAQPHDPRVSMLSSPHSSMYGPSVAGGSSMMGSPVQPSSPGFVTQYTPPPHQPVPVGAGAAPAYAPHGSPGAELPSTKMTDTTTYELAGH